MKNFGKLVALLIACTMVLSGCSMITVDKAMDGAEIVARVGDKTVTKAEAMQEYQAVVDYYTSYGLEVNADADAAAELKQNVLDSMVRHIVEDDKAAELGLTEFSDEEKEDARKYVEETMASYIDEYKTSMAEENATEEETVKAAREFLASYDVTEETLEEQFFHDLQHTKLQDEVTMDVTVTDEEFEEAFNQLVAQQTEEFKEASNFESVATGEDTIVYYPSGYRAVKHILISFSQEEQEAIYNLEAELADVEFEMANLQGDGEAEAEEGEEAAVEEDQPAEATEEAAEDSEQTQGSDNSEEEQAKGPAEETPAEDEELAEAEEADAEADQSDDAAPVTLEELTAEKERLEKEIADAKQAAQASVQGKIDEVQEKIKAGEDFDALIETYGDDPGMQSEPYKTNGYYISALTTSYDKAFAQGSMALAAVGDVSEPIVSGFGVHIIKYVSDLPEGKVDKATVRTQMEETLLEGLKYDSYEAQLDQWVDAAGVETFVKKMD